MARNYILEPTEIEFIKEKTLFPNDESYTPTEKLAITVGSIFDINGDRFILASEYNNRWYATRDGSMPEQAPSEYMSFSNDGSSRHSINDRIVDQLERMMDSAGSEYERNVLSGWIAKVEAE